MTGSVSSSSSTLMDMISMPVPVRQGSSAVPVLSALSCTPKALGIEGPVTSASMMPTR